MNRALSYSLMVHFFSSWLSVKCCYMNTSRAPRCKPRFPAPFSQTLLWLVTTLKWRSLSPCLCRYDWLQHWSDALYVRASVAMIGDNTEVTLYLRASVAMIGYNTEVTLYISTPLSTDAVSTLPKVWLMIVVAEQLSQVAFFSEDLKCWGAWDTTCGYKTKDITPSIAWRREALKEEVLDDLPWKDERGPSSIKRTLEPFHRQNWGNFWKTGQLKLQSSSKQSTGLRQFCRQYAQLFILATREG